MKGTPTDKPAGGVRAANALPASSRAVPPLATGLRRFLAWLKPRLEAEIAAHP